MRAFFVYIRMVLWAFFGVRRRASAGEEFTQVKPIVLVVTALLLAFVFGLTLFGAARFAVGTLGA